MKENFKILLLHIGFTIVTIIGVLVFALNFRGFQIIIDCKYIKHIVVGIFVMVYMSMAFLVDKNKRRKYDFIYGLLIGFSTIGIYLFSKYYLSKSFPGIQILPKEGWILVDVFTYPIGFGLNLIGLKADIIKIVMASFIPTILIGIGMKCRRITNL